MSRRQTRVRQSDRSRPLIPIDVGRMAWCGDSAAGSAGRATQELWGTQHYFSAPSVTYRLPSVAEMVFLFDTTRKGSNMNAAGHSTRYRPEYRKPAHDCCLPGAGNPELAEFLGVATRASDNWIATLGAYRTRQHHPWCFALFPTLYTGTKELSYPACRRSRPDTQAQGRVVKLTVTPEAQIRRARCRDRALAVRPRRNGGRLQIGIGGRLPPESAANSGALCGE